MSSWWFSWTYDAYRLSKKRAEKKDIPHTITIEELREIFPEKDDYYCGYCRNTLKSEKGPMVPESATLDRIIPEKGYTKDNITIVCNRCNMLKRDVSTSKEILEDIEILKNIAEKIKRKNG